MKSKSMSMGKSKVRLGGTKKPNPISKGKGKGMSKIMAGPAKY